MIKATLADLKPDLYIGVTSMPQADGTLKAIAIHIFQPNQRGTGEGHRPWDLTPGSMMTNAAIETTVASADGQMLTVKYKQGDKVERKEGPGDAADRDRPLCSGRQGRAQARRAHHHRRRDQERRRLVDAPALNYGRDGIVPPM